MGERPKLKLKLSLFDKIIEIFGWILLLAYWVLIIISYTKLPDIIPIHYNILGQADGFGVKSNIFVFLIIVTFIFIGLTILNKFPHIFAYPVEITEENALRNYTTATRMFRYYKFIIIIIYMLYSLKTIEGREKVETWFLLLSLGLIFIPLIYFLIKLSKE